MTAGEDISGRPVIFGEVLFDRFADGVEVLGGAPFNVAWHLEGFGLAPLFISRVGDDEAGRRVREAMQDWGMDTAGLQTDATHPTGAVRVSLREGQPSFDILPDQAYDHVDAGAAAAAAAVSECALVYHGTLILRGLPSREALDELCTRAQAAVFVDVNLRDPWWRESDLPRVLNRARWVKVSEEELVRISSRLGQAVGTLEETAQRFQRRHDIALLLVTRGGAGAVGFEDSGGIHTVAPREGVAVVDTVGAGDAFASVLLVGLIRGWPLAAALERAQEFASRICRQRGATAADPALYRDVTRAWGP
ncbi:MAG: carbohydrate kinase [Gammaproteobacteria bacterium]|nr:carbohydrate kinase [Gammaproteobacteria bacterium]NIR83686.1 carbohydrate kinase [Gammaproteobacteria bacterium]NIR91661.1 carbohydrate kinase [Gammaproteobacteria bacterium]NIU04848.1 carbohydrate kinase [Gammaproteobacteria bacterium]NIV51834.1 carbohydrate kinase [Gammaproteobacteria bacterium]